MAGTYFALIIFALITVALALFRKPRNEDDFLIKERRVGPFEVAAATFTLLGGGEFVTLTALSYAFGVWAILYFVGITLGFLILGAVSDRVRIKASIRDLHSLPDYFAVNFGRAAAVICTTLVCIGLGALLQIQFVVGSQIIAALTNTQPTIWVVALAAVVCFYLYVAGFRGVLATDVIQAVVMLISLLLLSFSLQPVTTTSVGATFSSTGIPLGDAVGLVVLGIFAIGGGADVWQRVYAAETTQAARRGLLVNAIGWLAFGIILVWLAHGIQVKLPSANPNTAFVEFVTTGLPPSLGPLVALLILSAVMSTADVEVFVLAIMLNKEFVRGGRGRASREMTKIMLLGVTFVSALLAIFARNLVDIYFLILYLLAVVGPIAIVRALGRGNTATALIGLIGGCLVILVLLATNQMIGWNQLLVIVPALPSLLVKATEVDGESDDGERSEALTA